MIRIEIEHLWAQRKIHEDLITQLEDFAHAIIAARDEELRKQEPVAWMACSGSGTTVLPDERMNKDYYNIPLYAAPIPPDNHDWKAEYLRQVDLHNQTLDELREAEMQLRNPAPTPPTPSQQEAQWQPIETAPRDGRLMIAHNLIMNSTYVVGWDARNKDDGPHWSDVPNRNAAESLWFNGAYFSHWMPLPTRPDEVTK